MTRLKEIDDFLAKDIQEQTEERIVGQTVDVSVPQTNYCRCARVKHRESN